MHNFESLRPEAEVIVARYEQKRAAMSPVLLNGGMLAMS